MVEPVKRLLSNPEVASNSNWKTNKRGSNESFRNRTRLSAFWYIEPGNWSAQTAARPGSPPSQTRTSPGLSAYFKASRSSKSIVNTSETSMWCQRTLMFLR